MDFGCLLGCLVLEGWFVSGFGYCAIAGLAFGLFGVPAAWWLGVLFGCGIGCAGVGFWLLVVGLWHGLMVVVCV